MTAMEAGNISSLEEVWNLQFDTGEIEYGVDGLAVLGKEAEPLDTTTPPCASSAAPVRGRTTVATSEAKRNPWF